MIVLPCVALAALSLTADSPAREPFVFGLDLPVPDVASAAERYSKALAFNVVFGPTEDGGAVLEGGGLALVLRKSDAPEPDAGAARAFLERSPGEAARLVMTVENVAEAERALAAMGLSGRIDIRGGASGPARKGTRSAAVLLGAERLGPGAGFSLDAAAPVATPAGRAARLASSVSGVPFRLVERSPARLAFERFRALSGEWIGKSTQGWTDRVSFEAIARGSVVIETSAFDAHPGERMMTAFHMDGERLLLTHYCVAGNQPRLVATAFEDDGRRITFEFLDGTNLASRDAGHMDKAVFEFGGADRLSSRWTWYQAGAESWMETITLERSDRERRGE